MAIATETEPRIAPQASVRTRLTVRLHSRAFDEALARGAPPETSAPLALRARRLTSLCRRRVIADALRPMIGHAYAGRPSSRVRVSPRPSRIIAAGDELARLADGLASPGPVAARGVAQAWILLTDGTGPLYNANSPADLRAWAASAANNLPLED